MLKKLFILLTLTIFFSAGCTKVNQSPTTPSQFIHHVTIADQNLNVALAETNSEKTLGLGGVKKLESDQGMLFDFRTSEQKQPGFWMKDMQFGLDILWIKDDTVIGIQENIPAPDPETKLTTYFPPGPIDWVLEINAGWSALHHVNIGDKIDLPF